MSSGEGLLLGFYGDDFTGSTDGMEALAKAGLRTILFLEPPTSAQLARFEGVRAVGVAGVSRSLSPQEMDAELPPLFAKMHALPIPLFHVKICSTFDSAPHLGSVGRTIEIGQGTFETPLVPLLVGAPILNRFCVFGNLFARSGPESEVFRLDRHPTMSRHPATPMHESDLRLHLAAQTQKNVGLVDVLQVEAGREAIEAQWGSLEREGAEIVLLDILRDAHLPALGATLWDRANRERPLFVVGSSGVEYALAAHWRAQGELPDPPTFRADPVAQTLIVSGSCSPVTARQIAWGVANGFREIRLEPLALLDEATQAQAQQQAIQNAVLELAQGRSVIVHTCQGPDDARLAEVRGRNLDGGKPLGSALGRILRGILDQCPIQRVVVAGGDTSGYTARALGVEALETHCPMAPGSPLCWVHAPGTERDGLEVLFKGGQVGRVDLFGSVLQGAV